MTGLAAPDPGPPSRVERAAPWLFCVTLFLLLTGPVLLNPRLQLYYRDTGRLYYPVRRYIADRLARGELPLWYPWSEAGLSLLGQVTPALLHPFTLLYVVLPFDLAFKLHHLLPLPLAGVGSFLLARRLSASRPAAVVAGVAYGGCGFLVSMAASNLPYVVAPATVPWALWAFLRFLERRDPTALLLAAALLASCVLAGDPQSALLAGLIGTLWAVAHGLLGADPAALAPRLLRTARGGALAALWGACGLCLAAPAVLPALPRIEASARGKALLPVERENFFVSPFRLPGLAVTTAFDDYVEEAHLLDAGRHSFYAEYFAVGERVSFADSIHLGLPVLLLSLLAPLAGRRGRFLLLLGLAAVLASCGMALGVWDALAGLIPGFGYFRYAEKLVAPASLLLALAAALGLDAALAAPRRTWLGAGLALTAGLGLLMLRARLAAARGAVEAALAEAGRQHFPEAAHAFAGALDEALLRAASLAAVLGLCLALALARTRLRALAPWLAAGAVAASTLSAGSGLLFAASVDLLHEPPRLAQQLLAEEGPSEGRWRLNADPSSLLAPRPVSGDSRFATTASVLLALQPQFEALFHIEGANSYFSLHDLAYERLRAAAMTRADQLLDVRLVSLAPGATSAALAGRSGFHPAADGFLVRRNPPRPRAFLVDQLVWAATLDEQLAHFASPSFDLARQAIVASADAPLLGPLSGLPRGEQGPGRVAWSRRSPEWMRVQVQSARRQLLVVSEHWDPGWRARVDGLDAPVVRVDAAVLGVPVAAGNHAVELHFWPTGLTAGLAVCLLAVLALLGAIFWSRRHRLSPALTIRVTPASLSAPVASEGLQNLLAPGLLKPSPSSHPSGGKK